MDYDKKITELELDVLLLFYTFSDQYGKVDMVKSRKWARDKYGLEINMPEFVLTQEHINVLIDNGVLPDVLSMIDIIKKCDK